MSSYNAILAGNIESRGQNIFTKIISEIHLFLDKMTTISLTIFSDAFSWRKSLGSWQYPSIGLDNGLSQNRQQTIIWTNADPIHRRMYAALGWDELKLWIRKTEPSNYILLKSVYTRFLPNTCLLLRWNQANMQPQNQLNLNDKLSPSFFPEHGLTHRGRVIHLCDRKLGNIGWKMAGREAIIRTNVDIIVQWTLEN